MLIIWLNLLHIQNLQNCKIITYETCTTTLLEESMMKKVERALKSMHDCKICQHVEKGEEKV